MTIDLSGLDAKVSGCAVVISVEEQDSLLNLANLIDWQGIFDLIMPDLRKTPGGMLSVGRKLQLRTHLGAYILQSMFNETDRETESRLRHDAKWQLFCGRNTVENWRAPDHTKIERFRNRLSPATHQKIGTLIVKSAVTAGFSKAGWLDVDSTVQEANIAYPSDATLMTKIAQKAQIVAKAISTIASNAQVDLKGVRGIAKEYFFLAKNKTIEVKHKVFAKLHKKVVEEIIPVAEAALNLSENQLASLDKRARLAIEVLLQKSIGLLEDIRIFIATQKMVPGKILSLHSEMIACIAKGKLGKPNEFGRVFQLGRIPGNFMLIAKSKSIRESDKSSIGKMIYEYSQVFGARNLESLGADKGYASEKNIRAAKIASVSEIAIQQPCNTKNGKLEHEREREIELKNRRAGIEPLIGHCKHGGLKRSRMKSDPTTESSAYRSVMGFNCRQLNRHILGIAN